VFRVKNTSVHCGQLTNPRTIAGLYAGPVRAGRRCPSPRRRLSLLNGLQWRSSRQGYRGASGRRCSPSPFSTCCSIRKIAVAGVQAGFFTIWKPRASSSRIIALVKCAHSFGVIQLGPLQSGSSSFGKLSKAERIAAAIASVGSDIRTSHKRSIQLQGRRTDFLAPVEVACEPPLFEVRDSAVPPKAS
jgi:hypothetical protein